MTRKCPFCKGESRLLRSSIFPRKGTRVVNDTGLLFDVEDAVLARPAVSVPTPVVSGSEEDLTPVAGVALWYCNKLD